MSQSIGSIYVDLQANTGTFVSELSKAAAAAQRSARDMSSEFKRLGDVASQTFGAFGDFNPVISKLGFAVESAGAVASSAMKALSGMGGAIGPIAALSAGAAVGLAAAAAGIIAAGIHAAGSAAKLDELSQSTGVSTEALSGLGFAAKQVGVDQETLVKGLEKMSKSAFAAATAPAGAINAFTRLGVAVRDASGNIRSTEAIFADLSGKFAAMPEGIAKTALEMEVFGRNGAAMAPLLDLGKNGIDGMIASAERFGIVVSGETAEAAERFQQKLGELKAIGDGFSLSLMKNLLPLLNATAASFESSAEGANNWARAIGQLARGVIIPLDAVFTTINLIAISAVESAAQTVHAFAAIGKAAEDLVTGNFKDLADLPARYSKTALDSLKDSFESSRGQWDSFIAFIENTSPDNRTGWMEPLHPHHGRPDTDAKNKSFMTGLGEKDIVGEAVGKLQAEAAAQLGLAGATDRSTAAMLFQKAAGEAEQKVSDLRVGLLSREKTLEDELANARANSSAAGAGEAAKIEARIAGVHKELASLDAAVPQFTRLYAEVAAARASAATSGELQKKSDDFDRQITSLSELAASYGRGRAAVASAEIDKQLEGEKEKIDDLRDEYARLASVPGIGIVAPAQGQGPSPVLAQLSAAVDAATAKFAELKTKAELFRDTGIDTEVNKLGAELKGAVPFMEALNHAYLENESAVRKAQVALELYRWTQAHPGATDSQTKAEGDALALQSAQAHAGAIAQEAEQYDIVAAYNNRIQKLEQIREVIQSVGSATLLVDAAIYEEQRKQLEQWDQAAIKVGTFGEKMRSVLNQVALDAENLGGKIAEEMNKAIGGIEDNIAKLIVTGKSNFKALFEGIAESLVKTQLQSAVGGIEKAAGFRIPGLEGKKGETPGNPLYVHDVGPGSGSLGPGFGASHSLSSVLGLGKSGTATTPPFFPAGNTSSSGGGPFGWIERVFGAGQPKTSGDFGNLPLGPGFASGIPSTSLASLLPPDSATSASARGLLSLLGIGGASSSEGFFSGLLGIGKIFAGFLAGGGDAEHGHAYIVGEKGPELFKPDVSGTIIPSFSLMKPPEENDSFSSAAHAFDGFRAVGGGVFAGRTYGVGEKHPEVFIPRVSAARALSSEGGMHQTVVNFSVNGVTDHDSFRRSESQIYANLHAQMELARSRG